MPWAGGGPEGNAHARGKGRWAGALPAQKGEPPLPEALDPDSREQVQGTQPPEKEGGTQCPRLYARSSHTGLRREGPVEDPSP